MKRTKYRYKVPRFDDGGTLTSQQKAAKLSAVGGSAGMAATMGGEMLAANPYNENGSVNDGRYIAGKALSRAGSGVAAGAAFGPWGMAIGGAAGLGVGLYEGITGSKKLMKQRDEQMAADEQEKADQAAKEAEQARLDEEYKAQQQQSWNQSYVAAHPELRGTNASIYAGGGLLPIANGIVKAEGAKHEQGGIPLQANGRTVAEVEDDEIIDGDKVFSDRLKLDGKSYAEHAEKLGKKRSKFEDMAKSARFRDHNTAERMLAKVDNDLDTLFMTQQASKAPFPVKKAYGGRIRKYGYGDELPETVTPGVLPASGVNMAQAPGTNPNFMYGVQGLSTGNGGAEEDYSGGNQKVNWARAVPQVLGMAAPFIDNIYNAGLIKKTPQIPKPNYRQAYNQTAMPMKTSIDISKPLADVNDYYRTHTGNIDSYTANSNVGRANKAAGFSRVLDARGNLFTGKENAETALINQNNMNVQGVNNSNIRNRQDITNQNYALTDDYNMKKAMREDNILRAKGQNVANATEDSMKVIQDMNMRQLDKDRIMADALKYNDGAGYARMIGTPQMDELMRDPQYYAQVDKALEKSGQTKAQKDFRKRYGKK